MDKSIFQNNPCTSTCTCIICHKKNVASSDEHIIPKALGGYMHTWNVCKECNSKFGHDIDPLLVDHQLLAFQRYEHQLVGQSKKAVPHPFVGTFDGEDGEKYRVVEENGKLTPILVESIGQMENENQVRLSIDAKNKDKIPEILSKYAWRNKLAFDPSSHKEIVHTTENPRLTIPMQIDIANFRLGILKIAYEFTANIYPRYVSDPEGLHIADILKDGNPKRVEELTIGGNGFDDLMGVIMGDYIDFSQKKRHYIMLFEMEEQLYCGVKLFNVFCLVIRMSDGRYDELPMPIIAINDFGKKDFELFSLEELLLMVEQSTKNGIEFMEPWQSELQTLDGNLQYGIYCDKDNRNLCFLYNGTCVGTDLDFMKSAPDEIVTVEVNGNESKVIYHVEGALGVYIFPTRRWIPVKNFFTISEMKKY